MIQNEHEYSVTRAQLVSLERALADVLQHRDGAAIPAAVRDGQINGLRFQIDDLRRELAEYESAARVNGLGGSSRTDERVAGVPSTKGLL